MATMVRKVKLGTAAVTQRPQYGCNSQQPVNSVQPIPSLDLSIQLNTDMPTTTIYTHA